MDASATNYTIAYSYGAFSVTPAPLAITPAGEKSKIYGQTFTAFTGTVAGLQNTDAVTVTYGSTGAAQGAPAGSYDITVASYSFTSGSASNYSISTGTAANGLAVSPAPTATTLTSSLGQPNLTPAQIKLTATVTSTVLPVGSVTFTDVSTVPPRPLGAADLQAGQAFVMTDASALGAGQHVISATFIPATGNFVTSTTASNTAPALTITGPPSGSVNAVNTAVAFLASVTDPDSGGTSAQWSFDTTASAGGTVSLSGASGTIAGSYTFSTARVYTVTLTFNDGLGGIAIANTVTASNSPPNLPASVVVYDPSVGFATGGGWINSPVGALATNPTLSGKATFGFVSKYQKGASVPTGETEFDFQVGAFSFHSTNYQWLVVSGSLAQYKGTGTINGSGSYNFILTALDGDLAKPITPDGFRIKITDQTTGTMIYDNLKSPDDTMSAGNTQVIGGGSIMIHSK